MSWGKSNEAWNHTASLMTLLASIHSDPDSGKKPCLADFHPYMVRPELPTAPPEFLASLAASLAGKGRPPKVPT